MLGKKKIHLEYIINCSPKVLFNRLCTASGLTEWFAEDVRVDGKKFTFIWKGMEEEAKMTLYKDNKQVRFNWSEEDDDYFEFRIIQDELTGDVALIVTDFAEEDELEEITGLWNTQISDLKHLVGS